MATHFIVLTLGKLTLKVIYSGISARMNTRVS